MAGDDPLPGVKKHGVTGYNKGCKCFVCRRAKADSMVRYRARRKTGATTLTTDNESSRPGAYNMELLTRTEIIAMGLLSAEAESVAHMAIITAKLIDKIEKEGTWHLLNSTTKRYGEIMKELRAMVAPAARDGEDDDEFLRGVGTFGATGAQP